MWRCKNNLERQGQPTWKRQGGRPRNGSWQFASCCVWGRYGTWARYPRWTIFFPCCASVPNDVFADARRMSMSPKGALCNDSELDVRYRIPRPPFVCSSDAWFLALACRNNLPSSSTTWQKKGKQKQGIVRDDYYGAQRHCQGRPATEPASCQRSLSLIPEPPTTRNGGREGANARRGDSWSKRLEPASPLALTDRSVAVQWPGPLVSLPPCDMPNLFFFLSPGLLNGNQPPTVTTVHHTSYVVRRTPWNCSPLSTLDATSVHALTTPHCELIMAVAGPGQAQTGRLQRRHRAPPSKPQSRSSS